MAQQVRTDSGMGPHDLPFGVGERAGLGEDRVGHGDLPHVVQPTAQLGPQHLVLPQAEPAGDRGGQRGDLPAVRGEVAFPPVAADGEGFGDVQAFRLLGAQVGGVELGEPA